MGRLNVHNILIPAKHMGRLNVQNILIPAKHMGRLNVHNILILAKHMGRLNVHNILILEVTLPLLLCIFIGLWSSIFMGKFFQLSGRLQRRPQAVTLGYLWCCIIDNFLPRYFKRFRSRYAIQPKT